MKKKLMFLVFFLASILVFGQVAMATTIMNKSVSPNGTSNQTENWIPLSERLNLSNAQIKQIKEVNHNTYQSTKNLKIKLLDTKFELQQLGIDKSDKSARDAKIKEIKELKVQIHNAERDRRQKIQSILTPEQQSKLKEMKGLGYHGSHWQGECR
ncbi:MAG: Spy/CpxP family protein refolding chaperone [Syntrophomonadaceae bacterium]